MDEPRDTAAERHRRPTSPALRGAVVVVSIMTLAISSLSILTNDRNRQATASGAETLVGAGDIAGSHDRDEATAKLLDAIPGTVFTTGDNAYGDGTAAQFQQHYEPTWGRHKARTRPSPGNHDYHTAGAADYFAYFGANAGEPGKGYYSYNLGAWHVIALNSNCSAIGGCDANSPQGQWLRADLAASTASCTAAYWHHPRFASPTNHGGSSAVKPFWDMLYEFGADVVLNGHNHNYERFAPQTPTGARDDAKGIRQFTVGTGGAGAYSFSGAHANSEVRQSGTNGVLKLTLQATSYSWEFVPVAGGTFSDTGSASCVGGNRPPVVAAGPDQTISSGATAILDGTVNDDGLPAGSTVTTTWSAQSGPATGQVTFADATAVDTTASFSEDGSYVLRLSATDGELSTFDDVSILVGVAPGPSPLPTPTGAVTTLERRVGAGNDDAEEAPGGSVGLSSSDLELVTDGTAVQTVGLRFTGIGVPQGATITSAWIQFKVDEAPTTACSLTIRAQAIDHAPAFATSSANISSRSRTVNAVPWNPPHWGTVGAAGPDQRTPDLAGVIGEVIARPGWVAGNAIVVVVSGTGRRVAEAYNGDAAGAPLLHVAYVGGPAPSPSPSASPSPTPSPSPTSTPTSPPPVPGAATFERRIATGNDDGEEASGGSVSLGSSDLELVTDGQTVQTVGLRFTAVAIPQGARITAAWVQFKVDEAPTAPCSLTIRAQAADNAPPLATTANNISSRPVTTAQTGWSPPHWPTVGAAGPDQRTPDLSEVIAEVTGRSGWQSGNALVIVITGTGRRVAESFNGDNAGAPLLRVEYVV